MIHEKLFFLLEAQAARKKKIRSTCVIVKTAFPKNIIPHQKRKYQSDPKSDPIRRPIWNPILVLLTAPKIKHFQNLTPTAKKYILLIFSGWLGSSMKQITTYFVWLNINNKLFIINYLFTRKSIITELRLNAAFGAQNLRRISRLNVPK